MSAPELLGQPLSVINAELNDLVNNLHIKAIRIDMSWAYVDSTGTYDWSQYDPLIAAIRARGLILDLIVDMTPAWASPSGNLWAQPSDPTQFATFAAAAAARYGSGGPTGYEVWNEPNIDPFWYPAPDASAYTTLLADTYTAIQAVQPGAYVLTGGLSPAANDGSDIAPVTFLQDIYADGGKPYFNGVADHPYSYPALPNTFESWSGWSQLDSTSPSIRSVMVANGDSAKDVDITEIGWPTNVTSNTGQSGTTAQVDELQQVVAFAQANPWIGAVYWFNYKDNVDGDFGLLTSTGTHKPAYSVFASS